MATCKGCGFYRYSENTERLGEDRKYVREAHQCWYDEGGCSERKVRVFYEPEVPTHEAPPACHNKISCEQQCEYCSGLIPANSTKCPNCGAIRK